MSNRDTAATTAYHDATKHSLASVRRSGHVLDFANMPLPFKVYPQLPPIPLPHDFTLSRRPALAAIAADASGAADCRALDLATLAHLLYFTAGVLRRRSYPGGDAFFRAQACTGNLHHIDLYLVCGGLPDLAAGVYHFSPHDFALRRLRAGDYRASVVRATGDEPAIAAAPVVIACASTFWRNAWKYQARTYRHAFWDDGTLLANLVAVAAALEVPVRLVLGFVDDELNRLLDLDAEGEVTVSLVALGDGGAAPPPAPPAPPLGFETLPLSARQVAYPEIVAAHRASSLASSDEVAAWRAAAAHGLGPCGVPEQRSTGAGDDASNTRGRVDASAALGTVVPLAPSLAAPEEPIERVILRRGSTREFARDAIGFDVLSSIVRTVSGDVGADFLAPGAGLADTYLIVNAVDGVTPGAYVFDRDRDALVQLRAGDRRREAGHLALGQALAADAAVNLYWLVDLPRVLARLGNRGYRAAQLEAAIRGGKTYLVAFTLGIGATGLTFFDDDVTEFFSPHAAGKSVMFLMAIGHPAPRTR
jgi:SagB-type dehydrogenase family enzyme